MKSLYQRQFLIMAGVILVSFAMLGSAFITLSYRYTCLLYTSDAADD